MEQLPGVAVAVGLAVPVGVGVGVADGLAVPVGVADGEGLTGAVMVTGVLSVQRPAGDVVDWHSVVDGFVMVATTVFEPPVCPTDVSSTASARPGPAGPPEAVVAAAPVVKVTLEAVPETVPPRRTPGPSSEKVTETPFAGAPVLPVTVATNCWDDPAATEAVCGSSVRNRAWLALTGAADVFAVAVSRGSAASRPAVGLFVVWFTNTVTVSVPASCGL
ncbi:MAG: hypothetical protein EPN99_11010 [Frankiales bacterium]|nr:MAG: hypothetical protein EPN99_11010 [Frankiales bacterium]